MLMKANNAYAIFFYHTLRYKINYTSVRRLCKINMLRMQDLYHICQECKTFCFGNMTNTVYKTHGLFFVFGHKLKQQCGTINLTNQYGYVGGVLHCMSCVGTFQIKKILIRKLQTLLQITIVSFWLKMCLTKMTENMFAVLHIFVLCIEFTFSLANCGKTSMFLRTYISHPEDCSLYYVCFHGRRFLKKCDDDDVFDINSKSCVPRGSKTDSCKLSCLCKVGLCDFVLLHQIY